MNVTKEEITAWLAGILEGEGSFIITKSGRNRYPCISLGMTDYDIIERVGDVWGKNPSGPYSYKCQSGKQQTPYWYVRVSGKEAVKWINRILPFMGNRRRVKIRELLTIWKQRTIYGKTSL